MNEIGRLLNGAAFLYLLCSHFAMGRFGGVATADDALVVVDEGTREETGVGGG